MSQDQRYVRATEIFDARQWAPSVEFAATGLEAFRSFVERYGGELRFDGGDPLVTNANQTIELGDGEWLVAKRIPPTVSVAHPMDWMFEHHSDAQFRVLYWSALADGNG